MFKNSYPIPPQGGAIRFVHLTAAWLAGLAVLLIVGVGAAIAAEAETQPDVVLDVTTRLDLVFTGSTFPRFLRANTLVGSWDKAWETVVAEARQTPTRFYILWENRDGEIQMQEYEVGRSFALEIKDKTWIRERLVLGNGSQVLGVTHCEVKVYREVPMPTQPVLNSDQ